MQEDVKKLKQYLLGSLSMDEMSRIDLRVIVDEDLAESLFMCETELIEEYIEGTLSEENLQFFHSNFLVSPKRFELMREISQLRDYAQNRHVQKNGLMCP